MEEKKCGIYKITNNVNGKVYIGQAVNIVKRWKDHIRLVEDGTTAIYKAMKKHGVENFSFEIIEECERKELNHKEIYYISVYDSYRNGYNETLGGGGHYGWVPTESTRKKIGLANSGENNWTYGKSLPAETKGKISEANKGRPKSSEAKYKMKKAKDGKYFGKDNPNAKQVHIGDYIFSTCQECANYLEIKPTVVASWANKSRKCPKELVLAGFGYVGEDDVLEFSKYAPRHKEVLSDNHEFKNAQECADYYKVSVRLIKGILTKKQNPTSFFLNKNLRYKQNNLDKLFEKIEKIRKEVEGCQNNY